MWKLRLLRKTAPILRLMGCTLWRQHALDKLGCYFAVTLPGFGRWHRLRIRFFVEDYELTTCKDNF